MATLNKKLLGGIALSGMLAAGAVFAAPIVYPVLNIKDDPGPFGPGIGYTGTTIVTPFDGFDWISNGSAVTIGYTGTNGETLTTYYLASANSVLRPDGTAHDLPGLVPPYSGGGIFQPFLGSGYEFTIAAEIYNKFQCTGTGTGTNCSQGSFTAVGGWFKIFYDPNPNADRMLGSGYTDGQLLIAGKVVSGRGNFTGTNNGSGDFQFRTQVTFTEVDPSKAAYFNIPLGLAISGFEIKLGDKVTSWSEPSAFLDFGLSSLKNNGMIVFQADGNSRLTFAPAPGTLALLGLGLLGMAGASVRRRVA